MPGRELKIADIMRILESNKRVLERSNENSVMKRQLKAEIDECNEEKFSSAGAL